MGNLLKQLARGADFKRALNFAVWRVRDLKYLCLRFCTLIWHWWSVRQSLEVKSKACHLEIVVTLTSHKARFRTLHLTLECLTRQHVRADRIVLWLEHEDLLLLPERVRVLVRGNLEIRAAEGGLRVYNKIIPALRDFPQSILITVDDDVAYPPDMIEKLLKEWSGHNNHVVCGMAFEIERNAMGNWCPFKQWKFVNRPLQNRADIVPFGVGGVLYPPGALSSETSNKELFLKLAPFADDLWLFWMGRLNGTKYSRIPQTWSVVEWPFSQRSALKHDNNMFRNDQQVAALGGALGWPTVD